MVWQNPHVRFLWHKIWEMFLWHLAETIQKVLKIAENAKCGNVDFGLVFTEL
jgi:hypothetical protein